jgi:sugar phosphate isomerase/epimerase
MLWTRAEFLTGAAASLLGFWLQDPAPGGAPRRRMGIGAHSYGFRHFEDPFAFLEHARSLGAGGVQTSVGIRDEAFADRLKAKVEEHGLYLEGSIALPRTPADVDHFTAEVRTLKRCGASVFRTVLLGGRRYEVLESPEAFRTFLEQAKQSVALARPVVEKAEVHLAIENHKDLRAVELVDLVKAQDSPFVGVCVDLGNDIALLQTPEETVRMLAPHAFTTHVKDMGVEEYADGFLLSEVPLGTGTLDLPALIAILRRARPGIRLNLEMMTRDPLKIPCLLPKYWATFAGVPGDRLAAMLKWVRANASKTPLPRVSGLSKDEQLARENDNVKLCVAYARDHLDE